MVEKVRDKKTAEHNQKWTYVGINGALFKLRKRQRTDCLTSADIDIMPRLQNKEVSAS